MNEFLYTKNGLIKFDTVTGVEMTETCSPENSSLRPWGIKITTCQGMIYIPFYEFYETKEQMEYGFSIIKNQIEKYYGA
jgi:hypothetical protein